MPKILSDAAYLALKGKADNFDAVVNSVVASNEGLTAEEVNLEIIQTAITTEVVDNVSTERITQLEASVTALTTERDTLKTENGELMKLPGAKSAIVIPEADTTTDDGADSMLTFAQKHKGDTFAIATEMKKRGLN